jgi:hypothetical protein
MSNLDVLEQKVEALAKKWETDTAAVWARLHAWVVQHLAAAETDAKAAEKQAGKDLEKVGTAISDSAAKP